ncbi:G-protein-coupled receptor family protein [Cavenderia fasciculata]|uniref:G-protein-coupled receptor family protein n=1 Tax=Cavenderia fasciculata TaxID=261658 RepID=F4QBM6_CACFS|nr:G-protein-coupled receptor family protein [Cavenderia fasciculata]EGG14614.1 G-protein-coupled receptor family protein [Cavenderia fasciculata]|eukprot:XP_004351122.1 G-protein-coupled receptor family protein [Cavenderia fasciculata]
MVKNSSSIRLKTISLILVLIFTFLVSIIRSDGIVDIGATCEPFNSSLGVCVGIIPNDTIIYVPFNSSQSTMAQNATEIFNFLSLTNEECQSAASVIVCGMFFKPCTIVNTPTNNISLPSLTCQSKCMEAFQPCQIYLSQFPALSCSSVVNGEPEYPNISTSFNLTQYGGSSNQSINCNSIYTPLARNSCPEPLVYMTLEMYDTPNYFNITPTCAIPCPFEAWGNNQKTLNATSRALTSIGFICSFIILILYAVLPNKITHKMECILSFAVSTMIVSISYFIEMANTRFPCGGGEGDRYAVQDDAKCGFNGWLFQLGALSNIVWWTIICFDYFLSIRMSTYLKDNFKYFRIGIWSMLIFFSFLPLYKKHYEATPLTSGCWIDSDDNSAWQYASFYVPAWICLFFIFCFTIYSTIKIYSIYKVLKNKKVIIFTIKQSLVMLVILFNFIFICFFKFYVDAREDVYYDKIREWVACISTSSKEDCPLELPDFQFRLLQLICTTDSGLVGFFLFAIDPYLWVEVITKSNSLAAVMSYLGFKPFTSGSLSAESTDAAAPPHVAVKMTRGTTLSTRGTTFSSSSNSSMSTTSDQL